MRSKAELHSGAAERTIPRYSASDPAPALGGREGPGALADIVGRRRLLILSQAFHARQCRRSELVHHPPFDYPGTATCADLCARRGPQC
jgi:hypothetical protein